MAMTIAHGDMGGFQVTIERKEAEIGRRWERRFSLRLNCRGYPVSMEKMKFGDTFVGSA